MGDSPSNFVGTPTRRLGLSRKSTPRFKPNFIKVSSTSMEKAVELLKDDVSITPQSVRSPLQYRKFSPMPLAVASADDITRKKTQLEELKKKLSATADNKELEKVVVVWKDGCKEAILALQEWMLKNENVNISIQDLAVRLGIFSVFKDHFETDSELIV